MSDYIKELRKIVGTRPIIMCGAGSFILNEANEILMIHRTDNDTWGIPGGALEFGETLEDAAIREAFEETNLIIKDLTLFNIFSGEMYYYKYPNGDEVFNVVAIYYTDDYEGNLKADETESKEVDFFPLNKLPENINPVDILIINSFRDSGIV